MKVAHTGSGKGLAILLVLGVVLALQAAAQSPPLGAVWRYALTDGSQLTDDCPVCDRIPIVEPLRGSFDLRCVQENPLFSTYALENIDLATTGTNGFTYKVTGFGQLELGGEVGVRQTLFLQLFISDNFETTFCLAETNNASVTRFWPMLQVTVAQTNGTLTKQYYLDLNAAPFREIWFSTAQDFVAGTWNAPSNRISNGDLLSSTGRIVKANHALTANLGIMPSVPDLGLKDVEILPGGNIAFSMEQEVWSEGLRRALHPGDLLTEQGAVLRTNGQLIAAFTPEPPLPSGAGLDAVKMADNGEIWFSVQTNFYSRALNRLLGHGDLLSESGVLIRDNASLISGFRPLSGTGDVGLRSVCAWPGGELWFTISERFQGAEGVSYQPGDLLSDRGYVVYRAAELLSVFSPTNGTEPGGLDALFVVTDAKTSAHPPVLFAPAPTNRPPASMLLTWEGSGQVFQLERATNAAGPFVPASPMLPDLQYIDPGVEATQSQAFYRLRQWGRFLWQ